MRPDGYDEAAYHQQNDILTDKASGIITFTIHKTLTDKARHTNDSFVERTGSFTLRQREGESKFFS